MAGDNDFRPFDRLLKAREVAQVMGVSESRAYSIMKAEIVPTIRMGKAIRVSQRQLEAWIEAESQKQKHPRRRP